MFKEILKGLTDLIYPSLCILCKRHIAPSEKKDQLCTACQVEISKNRPPFCCKCSRPLEDSTHSFCKACQRTPFYFDQAWGVCLYNDTVRRLIHLFKYGNKTALRHHFAELIFLFVRTYKVNLNTFELIVPIPLHPVRLRERRFNQSQLIGQLISEKFHIPQSVNNLTRIRNTKNQALLSPKERWTNIQGAFRIKSSRVFHEKNILIVDDLYTTGATSSEAARVLKEAGAKKVTALTLAITV